MLDEATRQLAKQSIRSRFVVGFGEIGGDAWRLYRPAATAQYVLVIADFFRY
jgi:hypothetical protein